MTKHTVKKNGAKSILSSTKIAVSSATIAKPKPYRYVELSMKIPHTTAIATTPIITPQKARTMALGSVEPVITTLMVYVIESPVVTMNVVVRTKNSTEKPAISQGIPSYIGQISIPTANEVNISPMNKLSNALCLKSKRGRFTGKFVG